MRKNSTVTRFWWVLLSWFHFFSCFDQAPLFDGLFIKWCIQTSICIQASSGIITGLQRDCINDSIKISNRVSYNITMGLRQNYNGTIMGIRLQRDYNRTITSTTKSISPTTIIDFNPGYKSICVFVSQFLRLLNRLNSTSGCWVIHIFVVGCAKSHCHIVRTPKLFSLQLHQRIGTLLIE